jgi:hypothetical protein
VATAEHVATADPYWYFSFEEKGRIFWFDFRSLWKWVYGKVTPTNPFTREPLSMDTRWRLRYMKSYYANQCVVSCQLEEDVWDAPICNDLVARLHEHGFTQIKPEGLLSLTVGEMRVVLFNLSRMWTSGAQHSPHWFTNVSRIRWYAHGPEKQRVMFLDALHTFLDACPKREHQYPLAILLVESLKSIPSRQES